MIEIISFVAVLGVLIFVHEFGHFIVAKLVGIRVEQFSLGFPPKMIGFTRGDTEYRLGWIPLGGYVKMAGERPDDEEVRGEPDEFMSKKPWQRSAVILAGPVMNYIMAFFILGGVYFFHGEPVIDRDHAVIGDVLPDSPAEHAGLQAKDMVIAIDDSTVTDFNSLFRLVSSRPSEEMNLTWVRGADTMQAMLVTKADTGLNQQGEVEVAGRIGAGIDHTYRRLPLDEAIVAGFEMTNIYGGAILKFLKDVLTFSVSSKLIGGPIFIAQAVNQAAREGIVSVLLLAAILSVNLCVINLFPIPVLDGGQLLFLLIEKIKGSPVSLRTRAILQQVGLVLIIALIIFVTKNDIWRIQLLGW
ncbi:MAG: RIP metalloprotease RseP [bacterium]